VSGPSQERRADSKERRAEPDERPPDLGIAGSWSARSARWSRQARVRTQVLGGPDTEELSEGQPPPGQSTKGRTYRDVARRWRFAAWLRDPPG
jgi:hypothetical protein